MAKTLLKRRRLEFGSFLKELIFSTSDFPDMPLDGLDIDSSDCCGNGCANCILNTSPFETIATPKRKNRKNALFSYRKYKLVEQISLLPHILQLKFKLPDEEAAMDNLVLDIPPGHHVMMRAPDIVLANVSDMCDSSSGVKKINRPYSPFNVDCNNLSMEFLVNLTPGGKMTRYIQQLKVGDLVEFRGPVGSFYHEPNSYKHLLIFTHGVAIAPVIRIIEEVLDNEDDMTRVHLICCFTNLETLLFRERLHRYQSYWNFNSNIYLSQQKCNKCGTGVIEGTCQHFKNKLKYKENIFPYRLRKDEILNIFKNVDKESLATVICGSKKFEDFVKEAIDLVDVNRKSVFVL